MSFLRSSVSNLPTFALLACVEILTACDDFWRAPAQQIQGIEANGIAAHRIEIGAFQVDPGQKIPVDLVFCPARSAALVLDVDSWSLPIMESRFYQSASNRFILVLPSGSTQVYETVAENSSLLDGPMGWKGIIKADRITIWHDCGVKATFRRGRLVEVLEASNRFTFSESGAGDLEMHVNGSRRVSLAKTLGGPVSVTIDGEIARLFQSERPIISDHVGKLVVSKIGKGLSRIESINGLKLKIDYPLDETLQPSMRVSGDKTFHMSWVPATGRAKSVDGWRYTFQENTDSKQRSFSYERIDEHGNKENFSQRGGVDFFETKNGEQLSITRVFASGPLKGKFREQIVESSGGITESISQDYDEKFRVLRRRETDETGKIRVTTYSYDEQTGILNKAEAVKNGSISTYIFHPQGGVEISENHQNQP